MTLACIFPGYFTFGKLSMCPFPSPQADPCKANVANIHGALTVQIYHVYFTVMVDSVGKTFAFKGY